MSAPISIDLRNRIIGVIDEGKEKITEIAKRFKVSQTAVYDWIRRRRETGNIEPIKCKEKTRKMTKENIEQLKKEVTERPDITLEELKEKLNLPICISRISRILKHKLGFNFKKNFVRRATAKRRYSKT